MCHTIIFDIGKTNKKCFVFDEEYREVWREYFRFKEIEDEGGFPCDDVLAIGEWVKMTTKKLLKNKKFDIKAINFSTYGASFMHIDKKGSPVTPLYNYLKPYPKELLNSFYEKYGSEEQIARETASPLLGMLNSGFQLYWLKYTQPKVYQKIHRSLHFPQYLSYLFTGIPISEFTSIGCHTRLWDYSKHDYHHWIYEEDFDKKLPPIVDTDTSINTKINRKFIKVGVGIHDSSAALLPYMRTSNSTFVLISTGTWSITLNPFSQDILSKKELQNDCLNFLRIDGNTVRASRLFLGNEYELQLEKLRKHFNIKKNIHKRIQFNETIFNELNKEFKKYFAFESLKSKREQPDKTNLKAFPTFEIAYHQLMQEIVKLQVESTKLAIGKTPIKKIFIDGGFADNDLFVKLIRLHFKNYKIRTTQSAIGSALGSAMVVSTRKVNMNFLKKHYTLKKQ